MPKTPRVGIGVIIEKKGQVLLIKRTNVHGAGTWSTPGGHLEYGESPEECAVREVKEETGMNIGDVKFRGITNDLFEASEKHYITIWMAGRHLSGEPVVSADGEASDVGWFSWDALPKPLFLPLQNFIEGRLYPPSQAKPI
ncbi:MAG: NUDIX domain-containing protein [Deltaproteobacteria bacterium]|nr:NUDIX domain-containing protein [Deltaproteobacteria bacterium]